MLRAVRLNPDMSNVMVVTEDENLEVPVVILLVHSL